MEGRAFNRRLPLGRARGMISATIFCALTAVLLATPSVLATPSPSSVVAVIPPYKHAVGVQNVTTSHTGPCSVSGSGATNVSATAGILLSTSDVKEHCANSVATIVSVVGILGPGFSVTSSGSYNISYSLMVGWHYSIQAGGVGSGRAVLSILGNLYDNSTGTWVIGGVALLGNQTSVLNASCSSSSSLGCVNRSVPNGGRVVDQNLTATLTAGDSYLFYVVVVVTISASGGRTISGSSQPGSAAVSLETNFTGAKHGIRVLSMTVS